MEANHVKFIKHLHDSHSCVELAAELLRQNGFNCRIPETKVAPKHNQWKKYRDNGDIIINLRIEVKGRNINFSSPEDWPYSDSSGQKSTIVCAKHAWDMANPKPYAILQFSKDRKCYTIVYGHTSDLWTIEKKTDSRYNNYSQEFYMCPIKYVDFKRTC